MSNLTWLFPHKPKNPMIRWEWPMAIYTGPLQRHAAYLACEDQYSDMFSRIGGNKPIGVVILKYDATHMNGDPKIAGKRMLSNDRYPTLRQAIEFTEQFIARHPDWMPKVF